MEERSWELYARFGRAREGAGGRLTARWGKTPAKVGPHRRRPAVLILPGGGYEHISARESEPVALRFLAHGFVPFVLEYSVAPARFPVALREAAMAMALIREVGPELEVDPAGVACVGFSAGGHLAGCLATLFDSPQVSDLGDAQTLRPDALGLCYPVAVSWGRTHGGSFANLCGEEEALARRLSLDKLVRPDMPPTYLWCTRDDGSVPCRNSLLLAGALDEAGVDFALRVYRHGPHGLALADESAFPASAMPDFSREIRSWPEEMVDFFARSGLKVRDP